jgi:hypothetical protein
MNTQLEANYQGMRPREISESIYDDQTRMHVTDLSPERSPDIEAVNVAEHLPNEFSKEIEDVRTQLSRFINADFPIKYDPSKAEVSTKGSELAQGMIELNENPLAFPSSPNSNTSQKQKPRTEPEPNATMIKAPEPQIPKDSQVDLDNTNSLISEFSQQMELGPVHRQSVSIKSSNSNLNERLSKNGYKRADIVIRAFECEPGLCGMVYDQQCEEVDSLEIPPPSLPFVDTFQFRKPSPSLVYQSQKSPKNQKLVNRMFNVNSPISKKSAFSPFSESALAKLPKVKNLKVGDTIIFKTPVFRSGGGHWRYGRIAKVEKQNVSIEVQIPVWANDKENELRGQIKRSELQTFPR